MRAIPTPDHHPYRGFGFDCYLKATLKNELQLWDKKVEIHTLTNYLASKMFLLSYLFFTKFCKKSLPQNLLADEYETFLQSIPTAFSY